MITTFSEMTYGHLMIMGGCVPGCEMCSFMELILIVDCLSMLTWMERDGSLHDHSPETVFHFAVMMQWVIH